MITLIIPVLISLFALSDSQNSKALHSNSAENLKVHETKLSCKTNTTPFYGPWQKVSCYKGIQYRTVRGNRENDGSYWWSVQFRNLYSSEVRFSYNIVEPEKEAEVRNGQIVLDSWRLSAGTDPEKDGNDSPHAGNYVKSSDKIFVYITKVRLAVNGSLDVPPIKCDY